MFVCVCACICVFVCTMYAGIYACEYVRMYCMCACVHFCASVQLYFGAIGTVYTKEANCSIISSRGSDYYVHVHQLSA